jgi:hypothetical protein
MSRPRDLTTDELLALMNARLLQVEQQGLKQPTIKASAQEQRVAAAVVNELLPRPSLDHLKSVPQRADSKFASVGKASNTSEDGLKEGVRELERARRAVDAFVGKSAPENVARPIPSLLDQHFVPASEKREIERDPEDEALMEGAQLIPGTEFSRPAIPRAPKDLPENNPFRIVRESVSAKNLKLQQESKPAFPGLRFFDPEDGPVAKLAQFVGAPTNTQSGAHEPPQEPLSSIRPIRTNAFAESTSLRGGMSRSAEKDDTTKSLHDRRAMLAKRASELKARGQALPGSNAPPPKKAEPATPKQSSGPAEKLAATLAAYRASSLRPSETSSGVQTPPPSTKILTPNQRDARPHSSLSEIRKMDFSLPSMPKPLAPKSVAPPDDSPTESIRDKARELHVPGDNQPRPIEATPAVKPLAVVVEDEVSKSRLPAMPKTKHAGPPARNSLGGPGELEEDEEAESFELTAGRAVALAMFRRRKEVEQRSSNVASAVQPPEKTRPAGIVFTTPSEPAKVSTQEEIREEESNALAADAIARQQIVARRKHFSAMTVRVLKDRCKRAKIPSQNMTKQQMVDALATHAGA